MSKKTIEIIAELEAIKEFCYSQRVTTCIFPHWYGSNCTLRDYLLIKYQFLNLT